MNSVLNLISLSQIHYSSAVLNGQVHLSGSIYMLTKEMIKFVVNVTGLYMKMDHACITGATNNIIYAIPGINSE